MSIIIKLLLLAICFGIPALTVMTFISYLGYIPPDDETAAQRKARQKKDKKVAVWACWISVACIIFGIIILNNL